MKHLKTKHWISGTDYRLRCVCFYFSSFMIVLLVLSFFTVGCILCVIINDCTGLFGLCASMCCLTKCLLCWCIFTFPFFNFIWYVMMVLGTVMGTIICGDSWGWEWLLRGWSAKLRGWVGMGTMLKIVMGMGWGWGWQVQGRLGMGASICAHAAL